MGASSAAAGGTSAARRTQPTHAVHHLVAVDVPDPAALAALDDVRRLLAHALRMRHRVPKILGVGRLEFFLAHAVHGVSSIGIRRRAAIAASVPSTSRRSKNWVCRPARCAPAMLRNWSSTKSVS